MGSGGKWANRGLKEKAMGAYYGLVDPEPVCKGLIIRVKQW